MRKLFLIFILFLISGIAHANGHVALGMGMPYGGIFGGTYSLHYENVKIYAGSGLLGYSEDHGAAPGYVVGFEAELGRENYAVGLSYGTVRASTIGNESADYVGVSTNYNYYFSGFDEPSFILGFSYYIAKRDVPDDNWEDEISGLFLTLGYQF